MITLILRGSGSRKSELAKRMVAHAGAHRQGIERLADVPTLVTQQ